MEIRNGRRGGSLGAEVRNDQGWTGRLCVWLGRGLAYVHVEVLECISKNCQDSVFDGVQLTTRE